MLCSPASPTQVAQTRLRQIWFDGVLGAPRLQGGRPQTVWHRRCAPGHGRAPSACLSQLGCVHVVCAVRIHA